MKKLLEVSIISLLLLISTGARATHLRAGEIRAERVSCSSLSYKVTVIIYTNTLGSTRGAAGGGLLSWGAGSNSIPFIQNFTVINAALHIGMVTYTQVVTFPAEGTYTVSYEEAHRNVSTLNIPNRNNDIYFYVENKLKVSRTFCDSSPTFLVPPVDQGCSGKVFYHDPGTSDVDGDSISYSLTIPKGQGGVTISGYADPNQSAYYAGMNYAFANSDKSGPPTFSINPVSGLLTWNAPGNIGSYNIAIKVSQWKKNPADSTWMEFGYAIRDMQIEILDCPNHPPEVSLVDDVCVLAGEQVIIDLKGKDIDFDNVTFEVFSDITTFEESPASIEYVGKLQSTLVDTAHIRIIWRPDCIRVRDQPYNVSVKITDSPANGDVKLANFRSFKIKVMGPPPVFSQVQVNPVLKKVTLQWDPYVCENAEIIQVWRRVTQRLYSQPQCETGMQKSLQYVLLTELPGNTTAYDDTDLAIGAQYCYRIVARFKDVASKISLDTCLIPQPASAPVITHVTVNKTDAVQGAIRVSWTSPFEIDKFQYPPPYQYAIQRGNGFTGESWSTITTNPIGDTTFVDTTIPTADTAYHYRVLLFVPAVSTSAVDTSSTASSVRLKSKATDQAITLTWDARVPWSIFLENHPYHYIYRSETGNEDDFVLIDSTQVNEEGLIYSDVGRFQQEGLDDHKVYFYKVSTIGAYGNPKIKEPFINDSQIVHDHLLDTTPPCAPIVNVISPDCDKLPCTETYTNTVKWHGSTANGCKDDVVYYEVYAAESAGGSFTLLNGHLEDSVLIQNGLTDMAVCYKVIAVDWVGNRSTLSESSCGENCPAIYMPNVFTPGVTPEYNDTFRAFSSSGNILNKECSRFIDHMTLTIINRYGEEVFSTSSDDIGKVYWDGKSKSGREMSTGVYYYLADVRLRYSSQKIETRQLKGWVQLIR